MGDSQANPDQSEGSEKFSSIRASHKNGDIKRFIREPQDADAIVEQLSELFI